MTLDTAERALPHWDMTPVFPGLESSEFADELGAAIEAIDDLRERFDRRGVGPDADPAPDPAVFDEVTRAFNTARERLQVLYAYVTSFVATDSRNDLAQARLSELQMAMVDMNKLGTRYEAWVGALELDRLLERSEVAREHAFPLRRAAEAARRQMTSDEEDLAASLDPSGRGAWSKLHGNVTSRLAVDVPMPDGATARKPMSEVRGMAHDPDRDVRRCAYEAELGAWEEAAVPLAAAMNSIKGWENTLNERRGWTDSLEPALFRNNVDRGTVEAMQTACTESFPDFRRYLRTKARLLGEEALPWWDLFAPVGEGESERWTWSGATAFITDRFASYSDALAALARRAFDERWIDAEPRDGKRDGGFCMRVRPGESRILVNFTGAFSSVSTVAHELGHAYHNHDLADRTPLARQTPMALAETASIFCQTIVTKAMLADASAEQRLRILEGELQHACQIVVDIHSRFLFERAVFTGREGRELSAAELCDAMFDAQAETYGDGVDPDARHPYMWAVKPHYYGRAYYNWPYTFGFLFGLGLYSRYTEDPDGFRAGYDELLSSTGLEDAATLAGRFGIDVRDPGFWRSSLDVVRGQIEEFEELAGA